MEKHVRGYCCIRVYSVQKITWFYMANKKLRSLEGVEHGIDITSIRENIYLLVKESRPRDLWEYLIVGEMPERVESGLQVVQRSAEERSRKAEAVMRDQMVCSSSIRRSSPLAAGFLRAVHIGTWIAKPVPGQQQHSKSHLLQREWDSILLCMISSFFVLSSITTLAYCTVLRTGVYVE